MKTIRTIFRAIAIIVGITALNSCSDDGPDYGKMRVSRMDIAGAKAVGFIDSSTGSRGEALSSGLYKIDANGNISAVAVYFTEDEEGNQTKHESEVRMEQAGMANVGNDYIYFYYCSFTDKHGEYIYGLPLRILVRKTDGKMWNLDEEYTGIDFPLSSGELRPWQFYQDYNGTLYYAAQVKDKGKVGNIYKFNLKTEPATIEQVTANVELYPPYSVDSQGIIFGGRNFSYGKFVWQNSGFQDLYDIELPPTKTDYSDIVDGLTAAPYQKYDENIVENFRGQYYLIRGINYYSWKINGHTVYDTNYPFVDMGTCNKFSIGSVPGSAAVDMSETINIKNDSGSDYGYYGYEIKSVMVTPHYILTSGVIGDDIYSRKDYWITALNPEKKEWKWVCETPSAIDFTRSLSYNDHYWIITEQDGDLGAFWFHPGSLKSGFVKFDTTLPSYMNSSEYEVVDGKVIFSGVNPADSHKVKIIIDLTTGSAVTNDDAPEMLFSTLISLN